MNDSRLTASFTGATVARAYYGSRADYLRWLDRNRHLFARPELIFEAWTIERGRTATCGRDRT